jgi:hypothetical protein
MYAYRYVDSQDLQKTPPKFAEIDKMVRLYFDTSRNLKKSPWEMIKASTMYMWDSRSPLQKYMNLSFKKDSTVPELKRWASMGPLYSAYGKYLIHTYPLTYFTYYILPNALKFYSPPAEFLDQYNMGRDTVGKIIQIWFGYKSNKVRTAFKTFNVPILKFMPFLAGTVNVLFILGLISLRLLNGIENRSTLSKVLILSAVLWIFNFTFSVFASPVTLRYQLFALQVSTILSLLLVDYIYKIAFIAPPSSNREKEKELQPIYSKI